MKIVRKVFEHPSGNFVDAKGFLWWGRKDPDHTWVAKTFSEVVAEVEEFCTNLGPERLVNVCEHTLTKSRRGDDKLTRWVVWYWADEEQNG